MRSLFSLLWVIVALITPALARVPNVVASIAPIHSLVALVMHNVGEPALLVASNKSPHAYSLRPSDARALASADLVFWIGPEFELFLLNPLQTLAPNATPVALSENSALNRITFDAGNPGQETLDPHLWLDPQNAKTMLTQIAVVLAEFDPDNANAYLANARLAVVEIDQTVLEIQSLLGPVRTKSFVFYHDAYRYFEQAFSLNSSATLVTNPELAPGARRVAEIRRLIVANNITCVFSEPQFSPAIVETLTAGTTAKAAILDPVGSNLLPGPTLYQQLLLQIAQTMADCLGP